jgi:hypothetical protein
MKATLLYRIAAVIFFLFGIGHTYGFLTFLPSSEEGRAVFKAMQDVHFTEHGASLSYGGFYSGFGVSAGIQLFFSSYLATGDHLRPCIVVLFGMGCLACTK